MSAQEPYNSHVLANSRNETSADEYGGRSFREQDRFLPIANVGKVMRSILGSHPKIAMESKECIQECVSEFISFVTSEAAEKCQKEGRKTLNGNDLLFALERLGFDNYVNPMKTYLNRYRSMNSEQRMHH